MVSGVLVAFMDGAIPGRAHRPALPGTGQPYNAKQRAEHRGDVPPATSGASLAPLWSA
jgi:hypothetical protein